MVIKRDAPFGCTLQVMNSDLECASEYVNDFETAYRKAKEIVGAPPHRVRVGSGHALTAGAVHIMPDRENPREEYPFVTIFINGPPLDSYEDPVTAIKEALKKLQRKETNEQDQ